MTEVASSDLESTSGEAGRPRPPRHDAVHHVCPLNEVLDRVSGKWAIGVLTLIGAEEVARFTELEQGIRASVGGCSR